MADLLTELIRHAEDHTVLSDELHFAARTNEEKVHLDHGRANLLRALRLPAEAHTLEVGAEYGALTRYLGEVVTHVDALELDPERASVVAARTADLPGVRVVTEPPGSAAYDLVVAVSDPQPSDLERFRHWLRPGGLLCLAVPNGLGLAQLSDHPAPGYSRKHWEHLLVQAGFTVHTVLGCMPDHRLPRVVFTPALLDHHPRLAVELAQLPSEQRERWSRLVHGGLGADTATGLLFLVSAGEKPVPLWPNDVLATFFNTDRAARWCTRGEVTEHEVRRSPLLSQHPDAVSVRRWTEPIRDAPTLPTVLIEQPWRAAELLGAWQNLVRDSESELGAGIWDLIPRNTLVHGEHLEAIDLEWMVHEATPEHVIDRGLLLLADELAAVGWTGAAPGSTVGELVAWLGVLLERPTGDITATADREAWFQAVRRCGVTAGPGLAHEHAQMRAAWQARLLADVGTMSSGSEFTGRELDDVVARALTRADRVIAAGDSMFRGDRDHYFAVAGDGLRACLHALQGAGHNTPPRRILDFGCGYGRVLRVLRAAFPSAELIASDMEHEGAEYCRTAFGAMNLPSSTRIREISQVHDIDLIWSGSVLTHLDAPEWRELFHYFRQALAPNGVAVITTHGRRMAHYMKQGRSYGLRPEDTHRVLDQYHNSGFGYVDYPGQSGYGISLSSPTWIIGQALTSDMRLAGYIEAGWDRHQDVLVLVKDGG